VAGKIRHFQELEGRYYTRIAIPAASRPYLDGKRELRHYHGDSRRLALRNHPGVAERFLAILDHARDASAPAGQPAPTAHRARPMTLGQFAQWVYSFKLMTDREARDTDRRYATIGVDDHYRDQLKEVAASRASDELIDEVLGGIVALFAQRSAKTLKVGSTEWRATARELAGVELDVLGRLYEREEGLPDSEPAHHLLVEPDAPPAPVSGPGVSILGLLAGYLKELAKSGGGAEAGRRWTPGFKAFVRYLGHDDARLISKQDVIDWKNELLDELAPKTVRDTNIAALRAVLQWAIDDGRLPGVTANPASGVKIRVTKRTLDRPKGFTLEEAHAVLTAARDYRPQHSDNPATRESEFVTAAKRWTPWLCAFSGARISEMTQLRTQDIMTEDGVTFMRITPDAGSVKTNTYRDVPIHLQLIEMGFLEFVKGAEPGPLFYNSKSARRGTRHASKYAAQRMATWIREVVPTLPMEVQPNHGWRHRFKSVSFGLDVNARAIDAMQGHAARTAGEHYGDVDLKARAAAMAKIPRYDLAMSPSKF